MMSGSGSTIFAVGKPSSGKAGKWQADLKSKHGVEIFEESFCDRPEDDRLWYGEQAQSAGRSDSDGNRKGAALAALDTLPPDGFEWGGPF